MGYQLIEERYLNPPNPKGISRNHKRIGFNDFLREINQEDFPYNEHTSLLITGLEDELLAARDYIEERAREIHRILQSYAGKFESNNCGIVQFLFRNTLKRGADLIINHPTLPLPLYLVFGSPVEDRDENGNICYRCSFSLSSPS